MNTVNLTRKKRAYGLKAYQKSNRAIFYANINPIFRAEHLQIRAIKINLVYRELAELQKSEAKPSLA